MMFPVYRGRTVQPGTAMTAHGDEVRWHIAAGPFLELRMTARQRSGLGSRGRSTYALPYPPQTARRQISAGFTGDQICSSLFRKPREANRNPYYSEVDEWFHHEPRTIRFHGIKQTDYYRNE